MTTHTHQNDPARSASEKALAAWREAAARTRAALQASNNSVPDDDLERAYRDARAHSERLAYEAWARPASADLQLRAEIVKDAVWTDFEDSEGSRRFDDVLLGIEPAEGLAFGEFDERAVAELVKAALWTAKAAPARSKPAARDWLALLRDAGPDGAAPDARHAAIWGAILDLRECRDAVANTVEQMTQGLDRLADTAAPEPARAAPGNSEGRAVYALPGDLEDLVGRARDGVTALWSLWGSHCIDPVEFPDQKFAASLKFCIDGLDALLEQADQRIEAAIEARPSPD